MKLSAAIAELENDLIRYTHEATTGTRFRAGEKMKEKEILRRKRSIPKLNEWIAILRGWVNTKARADLPFTEKEQHVIDMYSINIHDITTPVMR